VLHTQDVTIIAEGLSTRLMRPDLMQQPMHDAGGLLLCSHSTVFAYITLHYMLHSKKEWEPHSGDNERLIGGCLWGPV
jgi:hypothetical protein